MTEPISLDKYFFQHVSKTLEGASIEKICHYYVENLVFHNGDYLKYLIKEYNLPNDFLELHAKIKELATV